MLQFVLYRFTTEAQSPYRRAFIMGGEGVNSITRPTRTTLSKMPSFRENYIVHYD